MNKIFIDCGTHYGQGLRQFMESYSMDDSWKIYTFEANPVTHVIFKRDHLPSFRNVTSYNSAVSTYDGKIKFNIEIPPGEGETGQGSSVISLDTWDPWGGTLNFREEPVEVDCVDLSRFTVIHCDKDDFVVMKIDVEGAEYDILDKMLEDNSIMLVDHLYVEFHAKYFKNKEEMEARERDVIERINKTGVKLEVWH